MCALEKKLFISVCVSVCLWVVVCLRAFLGVCVYVPLSACSLCIRRIRGKPCPISFYTPGLRFTLSDNKLADDLCVANFSGTYALLNISSWERRAELGRGAVWKVGVEGLR